ncbi:hypothetical protein CEXT_334771 [Caerostris extrusa]|uniref:Uncharacterized protein n=1 Tax=Caerostris extrusa TaxID=172846 RepID=A0AAV4PSF0_CAEEX|nr:hypothetical protein CEXT_334771 [Caerostris extrusa]
MSPAITWSSNPEDELETNCQGALTIPCDIKITRAHLLHKEDTGTCWRTGIALSVLKYLPTPPEPAELVGGTSPVSKSQLIKPVFQTIDGAHSPSKYSQDTNDYSCPRLLHGAAILEDVSWKRIARSTYNPVRY